jgi:hypothetical protein
MRLLVKLVLEFCMLYLRGNSARVEGYAQCNVSHCEQRGEVNDLSMQFDAGKVHGDKLTRPIDGWIGSSNHSERCRVKV